MLCPSCDRENATDRVECVYCDALLVDVFASSESRASSDEKTDPTGIFGTPPSDRSIETESGFTRLTPGVQYSGDLPRLFRFGNRYQVLEKLGEGGMGRVYKALDLELDRPIALKTIRAEKGRGSDVLKRFKQELILARKVTHKNVVRIYDLGEAEGLKFFTMELVEGESLRDILREKKKLPVKEALSFLKQMLSGLAEAHGQGIVHRDLKPHNIMVDREGVLRIMDFGIARSADTATLTGTGEMMGTPDYISPEQVKGETATAQADLYSTGVILYELLTGEVPFKGDTPISKVVARLQVKPTPPRSLNPEIPSYLERIVLKLMEVDPDLRYRTAQEVVQDLEREQVDRSFLLRTRKFLRRRRRWVLAACLAGAMAMVSRFLPDGSASADVSTLAILPIQNRTGDPELAWMEWGIPEMLSTDISQSPTTRPILPERVDRILTQLGKKDIRRFDEPALATISEVANVDHVLHGSFVKDDSRLRIDLMLRDSVTGVTTPIKIEGPASNIFALIDAITEQLSGPLKIDSLFARNRPIEDLVRSPEAFRVYQLGQEATQRGANQAAIPLFEQSIRLDPDFVMAHARLAEAYYHIGDETQAVASIERAEALAQEARLPVVDRYKVHAISARIHDDPETAVASYRELAKLFPDDPDILSRLASSLETLGDVSESIKAYERVLEVSPKHGAALLGLGRMLVVSGRSGEAIPLLRTAVASGGFEGDPEAMGMIHSILGVAYRDMAQYERAIEEFEKSLTFRRQGDDRRGVATSLANLAGALRRVRRFDEARRYLDESLSMAREMNNKTMESLALLNLGNLYAEMGVQDRAIEHFRRSLDIEWERGEHTELAIRLDSIAEVQMGRGLLTDALAFVELSKTHLERSDDVRQQAFNLRMFGEIERARGDYSEAQKAFLEALQHYQKIGSAKDTATVQLLLSGLYAPQGRFAEAFHYVDAAEKLVRERPELSDTIVKMTRAEVYLEMGAAPEAFDELPPLDTALSETAGAEQLRFRLVHASAAQRCGRSQDQAIRDLHAIFEQTDFLELRIRAALELGQHQARRGKTEAAIRLLSSAREEATSRGLHPLQAVASLRLSTVYLEAQNPDAARPLAEEALEIAERFEGRLLEAEANRILAEAAAARDRVDESKKFHARSREILTALLDQMPSALAPIFARAQHLEATSPSGE